MVDFILGERREDFLLPPNELIGFLNVSQHDFSLLYRYLDEDKPIEISPIPILYDMEFFGDEVIKTLQILYGKDIDFVKMMNNSDTFRDAINYISNDRNSITTELTLTNLSNGKEVSESIKNEPYYYFNKTDGFHQDVFYDPLDELIDGFKDLNYRAKRPKAAEITNWIDEQIIKEIIPQIMEEGVLYDSQEWIFKTAYNCNFVLDGIMSNGIIQIELKITNENY
jgi:hypothetical protein